MIFQNGSYFFPNRAFCITFPIFLSIPALEVGMPVFFAISRFTCVMPMARFHEKLRPGMGVDFLLILLRFYHYSVLSCNTLFACSIITSFSRMSRLFSFLISIFHFGLILYAVFDSVGKNDRILSWVYFERRS